MYCTNLFLTVPDDWVLHITSVVILLAWMELMLLIGRFPTYGYYALMFSAVLQNVVKVHNISFIVQKLFYWFRFDFRYCLLKKSLSIFNSVRFRLSIVKMFPSVI